MHRKYIDSGQIITKIKKIKKITEISGTMFQIKV